MCNLENIQLTDITRPVDYDAYWEKWLKVCVEGIIKEHANRQRSNQSYNPLDQEYHVPSVNN